MRQPAVLASRTCRFSMTRWGHQEVTTCLADNGLQSSSVEITQAETAVAASFRLHDTHTFSKTLSN